MMQNKFKKAKEILKKYNQEHLLHFYDEISDDEKNKLLNQILTINFEQILAIYKKSLNFHYDPNVKVSPIPHIEKNKLSFDEIDYYSKIGEAVIKSNEFAVVTMAGGQGTRLGHTGPKGTFKLDVYGKGKYLFEILADNLQEANKKYGVVINWYIMTSKENNADTVEFLEKNNYFGYDKNKVTIFKQSELPLVDTEGKFLVNKEYKIKVDKKKIELKFY